MKILIISPGYLPITGNHGGAIENLVDIYLKNNEYEKNDITVYTVKISDKLCDKQIYKNTKFRTIDKRGIVYKIINKIFSILYKYNFSLIDGLYIKKVVNDIIRRKEENFYDIIIFENGQNYIRYFSKKLNTRSKKVLHLHNDYLNPDTNNAKKIFDCFDEIWAVSEFVKNRVDNIEPGIVKTKVLYNTIDYERFNKKISAEEIKELKKSLGIKANDFIFLYVGRIMKEKGTLELVKAFSNINVKYNNLKLLIVGGNRSLKKTDEYVEEVEKNANSNTIFLGQINNSDIYKFYKISDCQVVPSVWNEAFGLIVLEGVSNNLPIISTTQGGIPEIIQNSKLFCNVDTLEADLVNKMETIIKDSNKQIYCKDYENIIKKFSLENYCKTFNEYVKTVTKE